MAASIYGLDRGITSNRKKFSVVTGAITGTGALTSGLSTVDAALVTSQNSATTVPTNDGGAVTSITGGTINVRVVALAAAANTISAVAATVAAFAVGV